MFAKLFSVLLFCLVYINDDFVGFVCICLHNRIITAYLLHISLIHHNWCYVYLKKHFSQTLSSLQTSVSVKLCIEKSNQIIQ